MLASIFKHVRDVLNHHFMLRAYTLIAKKTQKRLIRALQISLCQLLLAMSRNPSPSLPFSLLCAIIILTPHVV